MSMPEPKGDPEQDTHTTTTTNNNDNDNNNTNNDNPGDQQLYLDSYCINPIPFAICLPLTFRTPLEPL